MAEAKREVIATSILEGGATKESLMELVDVNSAGLSSQFTYLRLTGRYPVKDDDGVYSFVDEAAWDVMKEEALSRRGTTAPKKSPEERLEALEKRAAKLADVAEKKAEAFEKNDSDLNGLRVEKANIDVAICDLELAAVQEELAS